MDTFELHLLILCSNAKVQQIFTNLLSPHSFKKNDEMILNYFWKQNIKISGTAFLQLDNPLQRRLSKIK